MNRPKPKKKPITTLSSIVLQLIFSFLELGELNHLILVCQEWKKEILNSSSLIWKNRKDEIITNSSLQKYHLKCLEHVSFVFNSYLHLTEEKLQFTKLKHYGMKTKNCYDGTDHPQNTKEDFYSIPLFSNSAILQSIEITNIQISERCMRRASKFPLLNSLKVRSIDEKYSFPKNSFPTLTSLSIEYIPHLYFSSEQIEHRMDFLKSIGNLINLKQLTISHLSRKEDVYFLLHNSLFQSTLQELNLKVDSEVLGYRGTDIEIQKATSFWLNDLPLYNN